MSSERMRQNSLPQYRSNSITKEDHNESVPSTLSDSFDRLGDKRYRHDSTTKQPLLDYPSHQQRRRPQYLYNSTVDELNHRFLKSLARIPNLLRSPRVRRYLAIWVVFFLIIVFAWRSFVGPAWHEEWALRMSLREMDEQNSDGSFGVNVRPSFPGLVMVKTLDKSLLPKSQAKNGKPEPGSKRLIFIGDIHGCKDEFVHLLEKVRYNQETDHLILLGDIITKGPDSLGVVDLAMKLGATSVRGNHEDRVLLLRKTLDTSHHVSAGPIEPGNVPADNDMDKESLSPQDDPDSALAQQLSPKQYEWLASCPVVLRVGVIGKLGQILAVHAGLVPGIDPERQDPSGIMTMRSIDLSTHVPSKLPALGIHKQDDEKLTTKQKSNRVTLVPWTKLWNKYQNLIPNPKGMWMKGHKSPRLPSTVIYGHDSKRGIQLQKWTKGLDSGCVKGGQLTALIVGDGGHMFIRQVECKDRRG